MSSSEAKELPGAHLALPDEENSPGESILKVMQRMFVKSFAWIGNGSLRASNTELIIIIALNSSPGIYLLGYYDFSIAWLITPLFLSALRTQWKKERNAKLDAARQAALTNEKAMIESRIRVEDLPSWVFFPDKVRRQISMIKHVGQTQGFVHFPYANPQERAEWVNTIIQQLWTNVGHYTRKLIAESIEPAVRTALEGYKLNGFR